MKVLIPEDIAPSGKDYLLELGYELIVGVPTDADSLKAVVKDCDAIICRNAGYPREVIEAGGRLKVIARHGVGVDNIDLSAAAENGTWVVNCPDSNKNAVAEYTVALIAMLSCQIMQIERHTRRGDWSYRLNITRSELEGSTLGIIGFGGIGRMVAAKAIGGFNMNVIAYDASRRADTTGAVEMVSTIRELMERSDYVSAHVPLLPATKNIINKETLSYMKKSAYFINCARGEICDLDDLYDALKNKTIAGAALDVYPEEPLPPDSPIYELDNVILSQHFAGFSLASLSAMSLAAAKGVHEVLTGKTPTNPVNQLRNPRK